MALRALSAHELAETGTLFDSFMGREDGDRKTVGELLEIYRERRAALEASADPDEDLRVNRFMSDMSSERWREDLVMRIGVFDGQVRVIDGTHRAIAYLGCVQEGVSPERLPALHVDC
ncbi:MAG TPA: hypothetical protein VMB05_12840 [Solirubrobacteraceae bacterium]|nr:hypothetical protein [Solirubrobacteraceae bacterium]HUB72951.1 hypothetical protein [Solirubrobacteraceae bacterium]